MSRPGPYGGPVTGVPWVPVRRELDAVLVAAIVLGGCSACSVWLMVSVVWGPYWLFGEERQLLLWYPAIFASVVPGAGLLAAAVLAVVSAARTGRGISWTVAGLSALALVATPVLLYFGGFARVV